VGRIGVGDEGIDVFVMYLAVADGLVGSGVGREQPVSNRTVRQIIVLTNESIVVFFMDIDPFSVTQRPEAQPHGG
jgi:hypothetical protein